MITDALQRVRRDIPPELVGANIAERLGDLTDAQSVDGARRCAELLLRLGFVSQSETVFDAIADQFPDRPEGLTGLAQIAMHRKYWDAALSKWNTLIAAFPQKKGVHWISSRARALAELGHDENSESGNSVSKADLAQSAMHDGRWNEALVLWDEVLARSQEGQSDILYWRVARANSLLELGRTDEAENSLQQVLRADSWMLPALRAILRLYCDSGRYSEALRELRGSVFGIAEVPALFRLKMEVLGSLSLLREARKSFALLLKHAVDPEVFEMLFTEAARLHEGWTLTEIRLHLLRELRSDTLKDTAAVDILRARLQLALRNYTGLQVTSRRIGKLKDKHEIAQDLLRVAEASQALPFPDFQKQKIIGIGLSKTATLSLATALAALGFRTLHWTNPLTGELIAEGDLPLFDAFTDIPMCISFEKQFYSFPNAKFIYTTRPLDDWCKSFDAHWQKFHGLSGFQQIKHAFASGREFTYGSYFWEIHSQLFLGHASATDAYMSYDKRIRDFFGAERQSRFLEFSVFNGDSWSKLCRFLGKDVPDLPFPFENRRAG